MFRKTHGSEIVFVVCNNHGFRWFNASGVHVKGYGYDINGKLYQNEGLLEYFIGVKTVDILRLKILDLNGLFSVVVQINDGIFLGVDHVRTFPLFYGFGEGKIIVSDSSIYINNIINRGMDKIGLEEFKSTGYVFGRRTIFNDVYAVQANTIVELHDDCSQIHEGQLYNINRSKRTKDELLEKISRLFLESAQRLINSANNRYLIIPLSGGLDSRAIVLYLHRLKYSRVICYTYGRTNSEEFKISKRVADVLGYKHIFINYSDRIWETVFSENNLDVFAYAFNGVSLPHYQDLFAITEIKRRGLIPDDSIIVPGHSGDLIGGSHLRTEITSYIFRDNKFFDPVEIILKKHIEIDLNYLEEIAGRLNDEIKEISKYHYFPSEYWNIINRQAKYINNSVRLYEFLGYEFRMPLWDKPLTAFFLELPVEFRTNEILYEIFLKSQFEEEKIDFYIKKRAFLLRYASAITRLLPSHLRFILKKIYIAYKRRATDYNNFSSANKALNCASSGFKDLQIGFSDWLIDVLKKDRRI